MKIPDNYRPVSIDTLLKHFATKAPQLGPSLWAHLHVTEAEGLQRAQALEEKGLIQFSISRTGEPGMFAKARAEASFTEEESAFTDRLIAYWDVTGDYDSKHAKIISAAPNHDGPVLIYTPEGPISLAETVVQRLHRLGLLTEKEGHLYAPSKAQVSVWTGEHGICDFCSDDTLPRHVVLVPDFDMSPLSMLPRSEGGWSACEKCYTLIVENKRTDLLRRALEHSLGGRFTAAALQGLHKRFWNAYDAKVEASAVGAGLMDFIEDRIEPEKAFVNPKLQDRSRRLEAIRRMTGLSGEEMQALEKGDVLHKDVVQKLLAWKKRFGMDEKSAQRIAEMLNAEPKLPPSTVPHWQQALDYKFKAIDKLKIVEKLPLNSKHTDTLTWMDMKGDLAALRAADAYSFSAETMHAIMTGAQSIPHESTLSSVELPSRLAGWFWFAEPYPMTAAPLSSDTVAALLWSWDRTRKSPTLVFSAYVVDTKTPDRLGEIFPSTKWIWPLEMSVHEMIALNVSLYRQAYGPGGRFDHLEGDWLIGEEGTIRVATELSLFFLMACVWFRQTVPGTKRKIDPKLTQSPGHIERHARKRYQREQKLSEAPTVRVIALRKSAAEAVEHVESDGPKRHLKVRFVVKGHPRLQPCGPGRKDKKLIWIDSYPKGPDDAPFKGPDDTVFAVIR